jgi:hypothetical protein
LNLLPQLGLDVGMRGDQCKRARGMQLQRVLQHEEPEGNLRRDSDRRVRGAGIQPHILVDQARGRRSRFRAREVPADALVERVECPRIAQEEVAPRKHARKLIRQVVVDVSRAENHLMRDAARERLEVAPAQHRARRIDQPGRLGGGDTRERAGMAKRALEVKRTFVERTPRGPCVAARNHQRVGREARQRPALECRVGRVRIRREHRLQRRRREYEQCPSQRKPGPRVIAVLLSQLMQEAHRAAGTSASRDASEDCTVRDDESHQKRRHRHVELQAQRIQARHALRFNRHRAFRRHRPFASSASQSNAKNPQCVESQFTT